MNDKIVAKGLLYDVWKKDEKLWKYLTTKLSSKGIKDNNLTVKQIFNYIFKKYK